MSASSIIDAMGTPTLDPGLLDAISERDRRSIAIRFLRSDESPAEALRKCVHPDASIALANQKTLAAVLLMVREDAPEDLVMTDPALYRRLRERITHLRMLGWGTPTPGGSAPRPT